MAANGLPKLRFEMGFDAPSPAMISTGVGIERVSNRPSEAHHRDYSLSKAKKSA